MFGWPGCCCTTTCTLTVTVRLCTTYPTTVLLSGATVTVLDGSGVTVGTATTNGVGVATITVPGAATYLVVIESAGHKTVRTTTAVACPTTSIGVTLDQGIRVHLVGCGCGAEDVAVSITRTSGPAYTATELTGSDGWVVFPVAFSTGNQFTITVASPPIQLRPSGPYTFATGALTGACTYDHTMPDGYTAPRFCYGDNPVDCFYIAPSALSVTFPVNATYGSLSGTTVSVPNTGLPGPIYLGGFVRDPGPPATYLGVRVSFPNNFTCGTTPDARLQVYNSDSAGNAIGGSVNINQLASGGTGACPVAFTIAAGFTVVE